MPDAADQRGGEHGCYSISDSHTYLLRDIDAWN